MPPDRYLSPILLQSVGVLLLIGSAVFWALTDRESVLMMSSAMSLIGLGAYRGMKRDLEQAPRQDAPPPIARREDET